MHLKHLLNECSGFRTSWHSQILGLWIIVNFLECCCIREQISVISVSSKEDVPTVTPVDHLFLTPLPFFPVSWIGAFLSLSLSGGFRLMSACPTILSGGLLSGIFDLSGGSRFTSSANVRILWTCVLMMSSWVSNCSLLSLSSSAFLIFAHTILNLFSILLTSS